MQETRYGVLRRPEHIKESLDLAHGIGRGEMVGKLLIADRESNRIERFYTRWSFLLVIDVVKS